MRLTGEQQCVRQVLQFAAAANASQAAVGDCSETLSDYFTVHYVSVYLCLSLFYCRRMESNERTVVAETMATTTTAVLLMMMI